MNYKEKNRNKYLKYFKEEDGGLAIVSAAVIFTLCIAAGVAVEVARIAYYKTQLQHAADSAVLAAISQSSKAYLEFSKGGTEQKSFSDLGKKDIVSFFIQNVQADRALNIDDGSINAEVGSEGEILYSKIEYSSEISATFGKIIGYESFTARGHAEARRELNKVEEKKPALNIHFFLDNSPSMGIGARDEDIALLQEQDTLNATGCAFACHVTNSKDAYWHPYNLPELRGHGLKLRIDELRDAVARFVNSVEDSQKTMGIVYP